MRGVKPLQFRQGAALKSEIARECGKGPVLVAIDLVVRSSEKGNELPDAAESLRRSIHVEVPPRTF
jgi:hypothetical protein